MQDQVNTLAKFNFNGAAIRVVEINGKPHFVGKDVADCLGYKNSRAAFSQHCKGVVKHDIPSASGNQSYSVIPESDVFRLILRSKAQHAEKFQDWVCEEVLPAIMMQLTC